jgi:hypothetical protein
MQFLLFASELRTRTKEILVRAAHTDDPAQETMLVATGYQQLARQVEQRIRGSGEA